MNIMIKKLFEDLQNYNLPKNTNSWNKLKCEIKNGDRIYWYYKEDLDQANEFESDVKKEYIYSGIVVAIPDIEYSGGELNADEAMVVIDKYPCEKCYPLIDWVSLNRLIDAKDLIEIYKL